jgi:5-formyltetrahydrofolate cyclo-ligase
MTAQIPDPPTKRELRRSLLQIRRHLSPEAWHTQSDRLCTHLQNSPIFRQAHTILAYTSFRQEPDLTPLFQQSDKRWGLPRCVGKSLMWHQWSPARPLHSGAYGILEPDADAPPIALETVDLILVPSVAIDSQGYRLGYGGGFYDRFLPHCPKPTLAILFDFAHLPELPIDSWDQPLSGYCTETGVFWIETPPR